MTDVYAGYSIPKKVLIIGADSLLAQFFIRSVAHLSIKFTCTSKKAGEDFYLDLAKPDDLTQFQGHQWDHILVFAAMSRIADCEKNPKMASSVNCDNLFVVMEQLMAKHWVLFSTNLVFNGNTSCEPVSSPLQPYNHYGATKAKMESMAMKRRENIAIVRLSKVLFPGFPLLVEFLNNLQKGDEVVVFNDMTIAPVWIDQVTEFLTRLLEQSCSGVFHLSAHHDISWFDAVKHCANQLALSTEKLKGIQKTVRSPTYNSLAGGVREKQLGFTPSLPTQTLDQFINWFEKAQRTR